MTGLVERLEEMRVKGRDIYEVANQLGGYVGPGTEERLAAFLMREAEAASDLADEIIRLQAENAALREKLSGRPVVAEDATCKDCLQVEALHAQVEKAREALRMISVESKEPNEPVGRSVFKALNTCGEIADLALKDKEERG
jgi:hypothetical protein